MASLECWRTVLLCGLIGSGCSTSYKPAVSPRVQVVQTASGLAFVRAGKQYEHGFFGGGLHDAVAGVAAAEEHADAHSGLMIGGFLFSVGGVGLATAAVYTAARTDPVEDQGDTTAGFLLLGALGSA